jgi:hypothetical protein
MQLLRSSSVNNLRVYAAAAHFEVCLKKHHDTVIKRALSRSGINAYVQRKAVYKKDSDFFFVFFCFRLSLSRWQFRCTAWHCLWYLVL